MNEKKIIKVNNIETKQDVLYPVDERFLVKVSPQFQQLWHEVQIPDAVDLEKRMQQAGLTMMEQDKKAKRPAPKQKKGRVRRVKLTNVHLDKNQIDLTQDLG